MSLKVSGEEFRNKIKETFESKGFTKNKSVNLEKGIYNYTIKRCKEKRIIRKWENKKFLTIYVDKYKSLIINISKENNKKLWKKIMKGKLRARKIAFMSHQELSPEKWKKLINEKIARDKNLTSIDTSAATDEFTCFKCKKNTCTYYQMQTRSADEPMTTFVSWLNCGNRWRF